MSEKFYIDEEDLGRAWVHANQWQWDELFGDPPPGFDELPDWGSSPSKHDYLRPKMNAIEEAIGYVGTSRAWWLFALGHTEDEWRRWFFSEPLISFNGKTVVEIIKEADI